MVTVRSDGLSSASYDAFLQPRLLRCEAVPPHIPVVDDNPDALEMIRVLLEIEGHEVMCAGSGRAIELPLVSIRVLSSALLTDFSVM